MTDGNLRRQYRFTVTPEHLIRDKRISDRAVRLWMLLDRYAGANGQAFPSRETLADDLGCSIATVDREILVLVKHDWLAKARRFKGGPNDYTLLEGPALTSEGRGVLTSEDTLDAPVRTPVLTGDGGREASSKDASPKDQTTSSSSATATRLPDGWQPDEVLRQWFTDKPELHVINPNIETEKFVDYFVGAPGAKGRKVDWPATWRNWMRTAAERAGGRKSTPGHTPLPPGVESPHRDLF